MKNILFALFLLWATVSKAQDAHFSQFLSFPLLLNPSLSGVMQEDYRLSLQYRSQWTAVHSPYQTLGISFDAKPFRTSPKSKADFSLGGVLLSTKAGANNYGNNAAYLSLASRLYLKKERNVQHYVSTGFQFGYTQQTIDLDKVEVEFPSLFQVDFDRSNYFDISVGATYVYTTPQFMIYGGGAVYHFHQPFQSFLQESMAMVSPRMVFHLGGGFDLSKSLALLPHTLVQFQNQAREIVVGANLKLSNSKEFSETDVYIGGSYRYQDALILFTKFDFKPLSISFSYDMTTSRLSAINQGYGGVEFNLTYKGNFGKKIRKE